MLLGISAAHLHPKVEKFRNGVKLLHSRVSGNFLLSGTMIATSVVTLMGLLIK